MATVKDIADEVGISKAAVSRILNHKGNFSQETILKVERAAKRLNYVSRSSIEDEETGKVLAVVFPKRGIYFSIMTTLLEEACYNYGYNLMLCSSVYNDLSVSEFAELLRKKHIAGILFGSISNDPQQLSDIGIPIVSIGHRMNSSIPYIHADNRAAGIIAAKHLLARGSSEFLYISNFPDGLQSDDRYLGFCEELEKSGKIPWPYILANNNAVDDSNPSEVITGMILEHPEADGLFAESHTLAMESVQVYRSLGYSIPSQVRIIGYGNAYQNTYTMPKLTLIQENMKQIANAAVSALADLIEKGKTRDMEIIIPVSIEQNQTT
ncbi:LacI family DNA-binding transcriptional regulator [Anaerolactibacter massiliensis]|uniref:LacI family DNA-binding transcriptional regulator n=1 Tax=Anaerolactibacter massiliensis TaxID=2044573 RepID=UPI001435608A|nr:substrate-binding domain-containing protein [Anaerolactibacter massiliensis]